MELHPLRATLFGDLPADAWPADDEPTGPPWDGFVRARQHLADGDQDLAAREWSAIAMTPGLEPRHTLQAWHLLRSIGIVPDESIAREVLGAVAEVAVDGGHDVLAAYPDGSARYLNHGGGASVVEPGDPDLAAAIAAWIAASQRVADATGPLDPGPWPELPEGHTRFVMLTRAGPHLGQGPDEVLRSEAMAQELFATATAVLVLVVQRSLPS